MLYTLLLYQMCLHRDVFFRACFRVARVNRFSHIRHRSRYIFFQCAHVRAPALHTCDITKIEMCRINSPMWIAYFVYFYIYALKILDEKLLQSGIAQLRLFSHTSSLSFDNIFIAVSSPLVDYEFAKGRYLFSFHSTVNVLRVLRDILI